MSSGDVRADPGARELVRAHLAQELGERRARGRYCGANSGNALGSDIERGAYSRRLRRSAQPPAPAQAPSSSSSRARYAARATSAFFVVVELADRDVAVEAEDAADAAGDVVVIDVVGIGLAADRAAAALRREQLVESSASEPVLPLQVALAVRDLLLAALDVFTLARLILLGILALPLRRLVRCAGRGFSRYFAARAARLQALHSSRYPSRVPAAA